MPVGVMTNMGEFRGFYKVGNGLYVKNGFYVITERKYTDGDVCRVANQAEDMNLSPASEQPWIAVNGKFNKVEGLIYETKADAGFGTSDRDIACFKITGIAKGYVLGGAV
jgi:hypothetical protein